MSGDNHRVDVTPSPSAPNRAAPSPSAPNHAAPSPSAPPPPPQQPPPRPGAGPAPVPPLTRRLAAPLGALAGVAAAFAYVGTVDPNEPGHYPVCPLLRYTGLYCPGCGGLRSAHAFIHGDLTTALGANAPAVAGYVAFAVLMVFWLVKAVRGMRFQVTVPPAAWWVLGTVGAVFSVVRNLPFGSALAP
ncbi:DUF2752 domain-containing protein [Streptomyces sp. TRM64462]|uniref:DUF2752 domain-containing protein n=1 Tax=Streptomyces sp. TRM64462 TaxID=2741726 RepID=UPI001585E562|nr:DUF2752 domain-containing protein [Streptomyces sp. TRM64462]